MIRDLDCYAATTKISCFFFLFSQIAENASPFSSSAEDDKTQLRRKKKLHSIFVQNLHNFVKFLKQNLLRRKQQQNHGKPSTLVVIARLTDRQYCNLAKHKKERKNLNNQMA